MTSDTVIWTLTTELSTVCMSGGREEREGERRGEGEREERRGGREGRLYSKCLNTLSTLIGQLTWHPHVLSGHSECDEGRGLTVQGLHQHDGSGATADVEVHHSITRCSVCDGVGDDTPGT